MISLLAIHNATARLLKEKTGCRVYSNEAKEGVCLPCFYCAVKENAPLPQGGGVLRRQVEVTLNYLPKTDGGATRNEKEGTEMLFRLGRIFSRVFAVSDRFLRIAEQSSDFGGENSDVPIFSFLLDFFDDDADEADDTEADAALIEAVDTHVQVRAAANTE